MSKALIWIPLALLVLLGLFLLLRPDAPSPGAPAVEPQEWSFDVEIQDGEMVPDEIEVVEGDEVNLRVTSDSPTEFHVHGYDLYGDAEPDAPAELSFDATITGRFEIEDHGSDPHVVLGELLVQPR